MNVKSESLSVLNQRREQKARFTLAANHATNLFREATKKKKDTGAVIAADQLIKLSVYTTELVEALSRKNLSAVKLAAMRREDFPMLKSRLQSTEARYKKMIKKVNPGSGLPIKVTKAGLERAGVSGLKEWLRVEVIPAFDWMREKVPADLEPHNLAPLSSISINAWAEAITAYFWKNYPKGFEDPNSSFYKAANAKRAFGRRWTRRVATLGRKYEGELDCVEATKKQKAEAKIAAMEPTAADIQNGFKEAVKRCLVGLVKK